MGSFVLRVEGDSIKIDLQGKNITNPIFSIIARPPSTGLFGLA